ncbi:MAG: NAD(P)-dependent alcohol dehydrogenase, partial [Gammaproteobacteria bacterium]|nr:NAD(P)-dependent alcohol dehydrogenase [Gammaproteobacteria bacterium]
MKISAAIAYTPDQSFSIESFYLEEPRNDEVLVRIVASGICHTDIAVKEQDVELPLPMILGHEGAGVVEKVGADVSHLRVGDHVVLSGDSCGLCRKCQQGLPSYCDEFVERNLTGRRVDGSSPTCQETTEVNGRFCGQSSFATHTVVSTRSAIKIHQEYPLELMGPLGCGLTTGVGTVMNALRPPAGSTIVVFGVGTVGLAAIMGSVLTGCATIIAVDPIESRRAIAMETGATHTLDARDSALVEEILAITGGGADFSVECSGVPIAVNNAIQCLARPGWCAQVGATPAGTQLPLDMDHLGFGRGIKGVVMGDANAQSFVPFLADLHA